MNPTQLINDLITEDPNHTIRDYLNLIADLRAITHQTRLIELEKQLVECEMEYADDAAFK